MSRECWTGQSEACVRIGEVEVYIYMFVCMCVCVYVGIECAVFSAVRSVDRTEGDLWIW